MLNTAYAGHSTPRLHADWKVVSEDQLERSIHLIAKHFIVTDLLLSDLIAPLKFPIDNYQ